MSDADRQERIDEEAEILFEELPHVYALHVLSLGEQPIFFPKEGVLEVESWRPPEKWLGLDDAVRARGHCRVAWAKGADVYEDEA